MTVHRQMLLVRPYLRWWGTCIGLDRCCANLQPRFVTRPAECDVRADVVRRNGRRKLAHRSVVTFLRWCHL